MKNLRKILIIAGGILAAAAAIGGVLYFLYKKQLWPFKDDCEKYFAYDIDDEDFDFDDECECCDCCDEVCEEE